MPIFTRSLRASHAYAKGFWLHGRSPERHWVKESGSIWFWGLLLPQLALGTAWFTNSISSLLLLSGYPLVIYRNYRHTGQQGFNPKESALYAIFCILGKFPEV
ncbi:MAG: hypothetical protein QNJ47_08010 [Nostocaceae cyanobacterium]|nr:hypothetical protein [Nostocaceae cyanobacterium]